MSNRAPPCSDDKDDDAAVIEDANLTDDDSSVVHESEPAQTSSGFVFEPVSSSPVTFMFGVNSLPFSSSVLPPCQFIASPPPSANIPSSVTTTSTTNSATSSSSSATTTPVLIEPGMKLEAVDRKNPMLICAATVVETRRHAGGRLLVKVHFDGWGNNFDYWTSVASSDLHPVGWCASQNQQLSPPLGYARDFVWENYLGETQTRAVPADLLTGEQYGVYVPVHDGSDDDDNQSEADGSEADESVENTDVESNDENDNDDEEVVDPNEPISQYVMEVPNYSSSYGQFCYCARKLIGTPCVYPEYGDFTDAMVVRTYGTWWNQCPSTAPQIDSGKFGSRDFIELEFEIAVIPKRIDIFETYNCGAIVRILARPKETPERWRVIYSGDRDTTCPALARIFSPPLVKCDFHTSTIRLELDSIDLDYYAELDAVRLVGVLGNGPQPNEMVEGSLATTIQANQTLFEDVSRIVSRDNATNSFDKENGVLESGVFDTLPDELCLYILEQIGFRDRFSVSCVCRRFFYLCTYIIHRKTEVDLQPYFDVVSDTFLDFLGLKLHTVTRLDLSWTGSKVGDESLVSIEAATKFISTCGSNLKSLRLACCGFVNDDLLVAICKVAPNLEELDLQRCPDISPHGFGEIAKLSGIKRLNLHETCVSQSSLTNILMSCSRIEHLNLGHCREFHTAYTEIVELIAEKCPNLVSIDLWFWRDLRVEGVVALLSKCRGLQEIDCGWCKSVRLSQVMGMLGDTPLPKLKKIFCTSVNDMTDEFVRALATQCPGLEQLDMLNHNNVTPEAVVFLLEECRNLKFIDLSFCSLLGKDLVSSWIEKYPHISIKKSFSR